MTCYVYFDEGVSRWKTLHKNAGGLVPENQNFGQYMELSEKYGYSWKLGKALPYFGIEIADLLVFICSASLNLARYVEIF